MGLDLQQHNSKEGGRFFTDKNDYRGVGACFVVDHLKKFLREYFSDRKLSFNERIKLKEGNEYEAELSRILHEEDFLIEEDVLHLRELPNKGDEGYSVRIWGQEGDFGSVWFSWAARKGGGGSCGYLKESDRYEYNF